MFSKIWTKQSMNSSLNKLIEAIQTADAIVIGVGSGLSTSSGLTYYGERFIEYFEDFYKKYHITDMYSGGFYPFKYLEEYWAWWSRHIYVNRYMHPPKSVYRDLFELVKDKNYFVPTTNVDHQFQRAGFDKQRLFYTQGDYGLWRCSEPCHQKTYDNEEIITKMFHEQTAMKVVSELVPYCPVSKEATKSMFSSHILLSLVILTSTRYCSFSLITFPL